MTDDTLRKALVRLAHSNPTLQPHLLPLLKTAGYGEEKLYAWVEPYGVHLWVTFGAFGRVHQITGDLKRWEKNIMRSREHLLKAFSGLQDQGVLYRNFGEVYVEDVKEHRVVLMYCTIKAQGQWTEEQQDAITSAGLNQYIYGFKPLPQ